jgi:phenylalanyl-tRNA synthetase beta chain
MKFSESWLREWVDPAIDSQALAHQLTMAGLEVDGVEPAAGDFSGVVVGEILACEPHPDADKLSVCRVSGSPEGEQQVVCGAPNARAGLKVPFALVGAELPGALKIKRAKLRGVESAGMLCAGDELGLSDEDDGLLELPADAPVGESLRDYLALDDTLIEVDLTPNRGDCLAIRGLAREVAVLCRLDQETPDLAPVPAAVEDRFPVSLDAGDKCPRYAGRVIRDIDIARPSPLWLVEKLRRCGVRSIDAVVDVTNYVMLELGQPLHAFDLDKLDGGIQVREAKQGEKLEMLDGATTEFRSGTLAIADGQGAVAMAGIMGGRATAVSAQTRDLFLESAFFNPLAIVGQARYYGLHTDSSHRFERGVDPALCKLAIERATALLLDIVGGKPGPVVVEELQEHLPRLATVQLSLARLRQQLAFSIEAGEVRDILVRLGLEVTAENAQGWTLTVPSWRFDLAIEADLVEEVARVYGYNRLPITTVKSALAIEPGREARLPLSAMRNVLVERGYREAITYSFVDPALQAKLNPGVQALPVANPIASDMAQMRTSLWPGLIRALRHNINRQQSRVRLFEAGLRFLPGETLRQEPMLAGLIYGERWPESWNHGREKVDFFDIKGDVEALLALTGEEDRFRFEPMEHPALHPGQSAAILKAGEPVGILGRLHPSLQKDLDLEQPVYLFDMQQEPLRETRIPSFREVSRFPGLRRDIAVIVDRAIAVQPLLDTVRRAAGPLLVDLKVFDVYEGKGIENNRKSVALGLTFQEESRTLNESEVNAAVNAVVDRLKEEHRASLRG